MSRDHSEISFNLGAQLSELFVYKVSLGWFVNYIYFIVNSVKLI